MFPNNAAAAAAKRLGKRKMREVGEETAAPAFNLQGFHIGSSSAPAVDGRRTQQVKKILNNAAAATPSKKPFSYMALLTADDEDVDDEYKCRTVFKDAEDQNNQISHMIMLHSENLRQSMVEMFETAEERAGKSLKAHLQEKSERNGELERLVELYKGEAERLLGRVRYLERTAQSLREALQQANAARLHAEVVEEEGESSFEDPDRVGPVRLDCKVCERQLATVMVWPCRHICVCARCDAAAKCCPVCRMVKTTSVEVCLPLD